MNDFLLYTTHKRLLSSIQNFPRSIQQKIRFLALLQRLSKTRALIRISSVQRPQRLLSTRNSQLGKRNNKYFRVIANDRLITRNSYSFACKRGQKYRKITRKKPHYTSTRWQSLHYVLQNHKIGGGNPKRDYRMVARRKKNRS